MECKGCQRPLPGALHSKVQRSLRTRTANIGESRQTPPVDTGESKSPKDATMCRWVAYAGSDIFLEDLLFEQKYSLISQSLRARQSVQTTNGDGFGIAWYDRKPNPGVFKDILPAWNDENLRSLASQVESRLFFAHVRASTGTAVARSNCHPFIWRHWSFMHNGKIGKWQQCRREVEALIHPDLYRHRTGTTDSEALFLVALSEGLEDDPQRAMARAVARILAVMARHEGRPAGDAPGPGVDEPLRMSAALTDGQTIWAFRYSSDAQSPTLYYGSPQTRSREPAPDGEIHTIASEPSDDRISHWHVVDEAHSLRWSNGRVVTTPFAPAA